MKKTNKFLIIITIFFMCFMCVKLLSYADTATITTETLRLRKEADTNSAILELISEGEKVEIIESKVGDDKNWYKVKYKGIVGYVYGKYIKVDSESSVTNNNTSNNEKVNNTVKENNVTENTTNTVSSNEIVNNTIENTVVQENVVGNNVIENTVVDNNTTTEKEPETDTNVEDIKINNYSNIKEKTELYILPLINASKIHKFEKEEKVYVIQIVNGWSYISTENSGIYGWVRCNNLTEIEE